MLRVVILVSVLTAVFALATHPDFELFKKRFKRSYATVEEEAVRAAIFAKSMQRAAKMQARNPKGKFGMTKFSDYTKEEFQKRHGSGKHYAAATKDKKMIPPMFSLEDIQALPKVVDWTKQGKVTGVKDQGQCGSCWAFSTTGNIEGQWAIATGKLVSLSEQELVSCDTLDQGCDGGLQNNAFDWLIQTQHGSITSEDSFPYGIDGDGTCDKSKIVPVATISSHQDLPHDEMQMAAWLATHGPIAIAVDAAAWQDYDGMIMNDCMCDPDDPDCENDGLDHGVLLTGYDMSDSSNPYWIIKNSWADDWGNDGYIWVSMGNSLCNLNQYPVTALVNGSAPNPVGPPPAGYYNHILCDDGNCTVGCTTMTWKQGDCISYDGVSFRAVCTPQGLNVTAYYNALDCTGDTKALTQPTQSCIEDDDDLINFMNVCP